MRCISYPFPSQIWHTFRLPPAPVPFTPPLTNATTFILVNHIRLRIQSYEILKNPVINFYKTSEVFFKSVEKDLSAVSSDLTGIVPSTDDVANQ